MMNDGWAALCIAIVRGVGCDKAFRLLEHPEKRHRQWDEEDIEEILFLREEGYTWAEIGGMFNTTEQAVYKVIRYRGRSKK